MSLSSRLFRSCLVPLLTWLGPSGLLLCVLWASLGFLPLLGAPSYESALVAGLLLPLFVAPRAALRAAPPSSSLLLALGDGGIAGLRLALALLLISLAHGLRTGFCSLTDGLALYALGPLCGALLAGVWGALSGWGVARVRGERSVRALAIALSLAAPLGCVAVSVARFLSSPMVFAFDPFVGFFSGTLYDTVIDGTDRLLTYRIGSLFTLLFALGAASHVDMRLRGEGPPRRWMIGASLLALSGSVVITALGSELGHWQTASSTRRQLGARLDGERCSAVYPATMRDADAALFVRDCEQQLGAVSRYLGVERPPHVVAYLFQDAAQKRRLMGAAETYIAKPWLREVYVQVSGYPHPVLGHELAHVVAGELGRGPFKIAGSALGLLPNPGLIEGIAVAASPDDDELSPEAWSKAMLELGILPSVESIFSLGFLSQNSSRAYTVAGAFVGWVHERWGTEVMQRWYHGEPLSALTGQPWTSLDEAFRAHVASLRAPDEAMALARARFDRPALFGRICPHEVDAQKREAQTLLASGNTRGAEAQVLAALSLDRRDASAKLLRATCAERLGAVELAESELRQMADDSVLARSWRDRAEERLGDLALARGDDAAAIASYDAVAARVLDEDRLRTLDVKRIAARSAQARRALLPYLIGAPETGTDPLTGVEELARWAATAPTEGLPMYLLGRNALGRGQHARAGALLDEALARGNMPDRIWREVARQRVFAGCATRDEAGVRRGIEAWSAARAPAGNRDALLRALAARCL